MSVFQSSTHKYRYAYNLDIGLYIILTWLFICICKDEWRFLWNYVISFLRIGDNQILLFLLVVLGIWIRYAYSDTSFQNKMYFDTQTLQKQSTVCVCMCVCVFNTGKLCNNRIYYILYMNLLLRLYKINSFCNTSMLTNYDLTCVISYFGKYIKLIIIVKLE